MAEKFRIESGIPLPVSGRRTGLTDVLRALKVGDSFLIEVQRRNGMKSFADRLGIKIATRVQPDNTVRVWRVA